jgi:predicted nucleic acid-binding protein
MSPLFADAFFFVALLNRRDRAHASAQTYAEPHLQRSLITTSWVLVEVGDAMSTTTASRAAFVDLFQLLSSHAAVEIVPADQHWPTRGLDLYKQRPDKGWSLTDCISFVVMAERGITEALTGDHHFEQAGFRALLRPP